MKVLRWHLGESPSPGKRARLRETLADLADESFFAFYSRFDGAEAEFEEESAWLKHNWMDRLILDDIAHLCDLDWHRTAGKSYPNTLVIGGNGASTLLGYDLRPGRGGIIAFPSDDMDYFASVDHLGKSLGEVLAAIGEPGGID